MVQYGTYSLIWERHGLIQNDTCQCVCTAGGERFATVQERVSTNKKGLKLVSGSGHLGPLVLEVLRNVKC